MRVSINVFDRMYLGRMGRGSLTGIGLLIARFDFLLRGGLIGASALLNETDESFDDEVDVEEELAVRERV